MPNDHEANRKDIIIVGGDSELAKAAARKAARKLIEAGFEKYEATEPKRQEESWRKKKHRKSDLPPGFEP